MVAMKRLLSPADQPLVNYSFTDIAAGTGYATFYGAIVSGGYILSNNTFYSNQVITEGSAIASTALVLVLDKDFDVLFNKPQNLKGSAIVEVPVGVRSNDSSGGAIGFKVTALIRKWDGTTETTIAQESSPTWSKSMPASASYGYNFRTVKVVLPHTHFKAGETLRVTINAYCSDNNASNKIPFIGHDPMNRGTSDGETYTFGTEPTILKVQIPLNMDI